MADLTAPHLRGPVLIELDKHPVQQARGVRGLRRVVLNDDQAAFGHGRLRDALVGIGGQVVLLGPIRAAANQKMVLEAVFKMRPASVWWLADQAGFTRLELHGGTVMAADGPVDIFAAMSWRRS